MYLSLIKKCRQQEKTYLIVLWKKYAFVFQSCDVDMKLLVENKVSHYPTSDVLLKKLVSCIGIRRLDGSRHWLLFRKNMEIAWPWMERMPLKL